MKMITNRSFRAVLGALALLCALAPGWASAAPLMTYQGRLKESGVPVTGNKNVEILFCNCLSGACAPACAPSGLQGVTVSSGLFRTTFTVPSNVDLSVGTWYLEVQVGGVPLSPREQLTNSPYAVYAASAASAATLAAGAGSAGVSISTNLFIVNGSNVGIGTTSPAARLHVSGGIAPMFKVDGAGTGDGQIDLGRGAGGDVVWSIVGRSGAAGKLDFQSSLGAGPLALYTNGVSMGAGYVATPPPANGAIIQGSVGIGTSGPASKLHVLDGDIRISTSPAAPSRGIIFQDGTTQMTAAGSSLWTANGINSYHSNASGNVGIGTTLPAAPLHVSSAATAATTPIFIVSSGTATGQELLRVQKDGNVGVGTTSPTQKLDVAGTVNAANYTKGGNALVPSGMIAFFAAACPPGWTEYAPLQGRAVVGTPAAGTIAGTVGVALANLATRTIIDVPTHTHSVDPPVVTSSGESATHAHGGTTAASAAGQFGRAGGAPGGPDLTTTPGGPAINIDLAHTHAFTTGANNVGHTHTTDIGAFSSAASGLAAVDVTMPYIQLTACQAP